MPDAYPATQRESQTAAGASATEATCSSCQAALPADADVCPACGQRQARTCFCGAAMALDADTCPACGADWSAKIKIRRRSRSVHVRPKNMLHSALIGALVTVCATALFNVVLTAMAGLSMPAGVTSPPFAHLLYYAGRTLVKAVDALFTSLLGGVGGVLLTALAGAVLGTLLCLMRAGYGRSRTRRSSHTLSRRRRSH